MSHCLITARLVTPGQPAPRRGSLWLLPVRHYAVLAGDGPLRAGQDIAVAHDDTDPVVDFRVGARYRLGLQDQLPAGASPWWGPEPAHPGPLWFASRCQLLQEGITP